MKIRFPWERDHGDRRQPIWVPVKQAWAGEGYGLFSLPRTDHEVLVAFVEGEPDQPVIVRRVHNALRIRPRAGGAAARPGGGRCSSERPVRRWGRCPSTRAPASICGRNSRRCPIRCLDEITTGRGHPDAG